MNKFIDFRSDTVTQPTDDMRKAMFEAEVGDDVYGDDPTVNKFEKIAAEILGKEAALLVPSGTFGNQLAIFTHCKRGNEVILGEDCHIIQHEVGAAAVISGVQLRPIQSSKGEMNPLHIKERIRREEDDIHYPSTGLICLENAHSNGRVISLENMKEIYKVGKEKNVPVHLDGARLFNAAAYLNKDVKELTQFCDTVNVCISKGLCAPIGSVLAGDRKFIERAKKARKLLGGGLRQAGFIAAAGILALTDMAERIGEDHETALYLAKRLEEFKNIEVLHDSIHINMVFFKLNEFDSIKLMEELLKHNIKINPAEEGLMRFVTSYWTSKEDIDRLISKMKEIME
ncbi:low-specificity L-threonine aldolase [Oceanirhabdus sp. W0125-5]|uniref:low-specificity L-threonine aldolase n=1 Tax=Oceanirhabdus sp. W0125-5 TaxID=2999116 RepID=UPI0022F32025|nr:low-specificity L-threonine aldolase [Oceanirhabdus sp. W0125-5]WBW96139.1 low-specificity L-threonine aldolase [Oceanirhabdus sp. W0125-5]